MLNILFLQNCVKKGVLSGGETRFFSILDNLKNKIEFKVFGLFYSDELNSKFNINKQRVKRYALYDKFGIFISYILRIFEALLNINFEEYDIIYSTSDFLPDVIPAFFYKSIHPKTR